MNCILLVLIACIIGRGYASLSGIKDGILYGRQGADSFTWNEHKIYVLERVCFGFMFLIGCVIGCNNPHIFVDILIITLNCLLGFSLWHNGYYYLTRGEIINTYYGFTYNSSSSTAVIELRWKTRLWMEISSWALFIIYFLYI